MSNEWSKEWPKSLTGKEILEAQQNQGTISWPSSTFKTEPWPEAWVEPNDIKSLNDHDSFTVSHEEWSGAFKDASLYGQGFIKDGKHVPLSDMIIGIDIATKPDRITAIIGHMKDGGFMIDQHLEGDEARAVIEAYNNKVPTHDPYTNPDMHIYHECGCGAILDPNTKSFATLNTAASHVGWKIRWGVHTYKAYCFECGKDVE